MSNTGFFAISAMPLNAVVTCAGLVGGKLSIRVRLAFQNKGETRSSLTLCDATALPQRHCRLEIV
jgi:hypothetical protein